MEKVVSESSVDESMITGESIPVENRAPPDQDNHGTGSFVMEATRGSETLLVKLFEWSVKRNGAVPNSTPGSGLLDILFGRGRRR